MFRLEEIPMEVGGHCVCCGGTTRSAKGLLYREEEPHAAYHVAWTRGSAGSHGAEFFFFMGKWGPGTGPGDRVALALHLMQGETGPEFMIVDAERSTLNSGQLAERHLARSEVIGTPLADEVFELLDLVWLMDSRLAEITGIGCCPPEVAEREEAEGAPLTMLGPEEFSGGAGETARATTPPARITLIGLGCFSGMILAGGTGLAFGGSQVEWPTRVFWGIIAAGALLHFVRTVLWYWAGRRGAQKLR